MNFVMEESMKKEVGLWLDHREAVLVTLENGTETTQEVRSNMEKRVRFSSSMRSNDHTDTLGSAAEDIRDRSYKAHLDQYYGRLLSFIGDADAILIIGPGEAKVELESLLEHHGLRERVVGIESADKMTNRQIAARVRTFFQKKT